MVCMVVEKDNSLCRTKFPLVKFIRYAEILKCVASCHCDMLNLICLIHLRGTQQFERDILNLDAQRGNLDMNPKLSFSVTVGMSELSREYEGMITHNIWVDRAWSSFISLDAQARRYENCHPSPSLPEPIDQILMFLCHTQS